MLANTQCKSIFHRRIGRHGLDIANTIMSSIGFDTSVVNKEVYVLKSTEGGSANSKFRFPTLEKTIAAFLWRRKAEIEMALKSIKEDKGHLFVTVNKKIKSSSSSNKASSAKNGSEEEKKGHKKGKASRRNKKHGDDDAL